MMSRNVLRKTQSMFPCDDRMASYSMTFKAKTQRNHLLVCTWPMESSHACNDAHAVIASSY